MAEKYYKIVNRDGNVQAYAEVIGDFPQAIESIGQTSSVHEIDRKEHTLGTLELLALEFQIPYRE